MAKKVTVAELLVEVGVDAKQANAAADKLGKKLEKTEKSAIKMGEGFKNLGKMLAGFAVAAVGAGTALFGFVNKATSAGDAIGKQAKQAGLGTTEFQKLGFAAERSGTNIDTMSRAVRNQSRFMRDAESNSVTPFTKALAEVGLTLEDLQAQTTVTDRLGLIGDALSGVEDEARKVDLAMKLVGEEAGPRLLPFLAEGSKGIRALGDQFEQLGGVISEDAIKQSEAFQDVITNATATVKGLAVELATDLIPDLTDFINTTRDAIAENRDLIRTKVKEFFTGLVKVLKDLRPVFDAVVKGVSLLAQNLDVVVGIIVGKGLVSALMGAAGGFTAMGVGASASLGPIGLIITALGVLIPLAIRAGNELGDVLAKSDQFATLKKRESAKSFAGTSVGKQIVATSNEIRQLEESIGKFESGEIRMVAGSKREAVISRLVAQRADAIRRKRELEAIGEQELAAAALPAAPTPAAAPKPPKPPKPPKVGGVRTPKAKKEEQRRLSIHTISDLLGAAASGGIADLAASTPSTKGMEPTVAVEIFNNNVSIELAQTVNGTANAEQTANAAVKAAQMVFTREITKAGQQLTGNVTR
jgi:hypothetical protein